MPSNLASAQTAAGYNLRIVWPLARYVEDRRGEEGLRELAEAAGLDPADFDGTNRWITSTAFESLLVQARTMVADEDEYRRACVHRMPEAYGPLRYLLWATSPITVYLQAAAHYDLMSSCGEMSVVAHGRTWTRGRFVSRTADYSRLNCVLRQAQSAELPTLWGLPRAFVREEACIARGDAACEYYVRWYDGRRLLPSVVGAALLAGVGAGLAHLGLPAVPSPIALGLLGAGLGYFFESRRTDRVNVQTREEVMEALRALAHEGSDARRELLDMHARQKEWTRLLEEQMTARTAAIAQVVSDALELQSARASTLLGFSHDLRNPLQIIQMSADYLGGLAAVKKDKDATESLSDLQLSVETMRRMLGELVEVTQAQRSFVTMAPKRIDCQHLTEGLRRRLRALVHGREVRTTVFATREAAGAIEIDPLALDRILDNLLTNAAKYTERGSIVVELDGRAGFLVIKVSDTGQGIAPEALERIFEPGGSSVKSRRGDSFGVGLSVVVQLLDQLGGRLEVMSRPAIGTTFWVHLPLVSESRPRPNPVGVLEETVERTDTPEGVRQAPVESISQILHGSPLSRVVTIRKWPA